MEMPHVLIWAVRPNSAKHFNLARTEEARFIQCCGCCPIRVILFSNCLWKFSLSNKYNRYKSQWECLTSIPHLIVLSSLDKRKSIQKQCPVIVQTRHRDIGRANICSADVYWARCYVPVPFLLQVSEAGIWGGARQSAEDTLLLHLSKCSGDTIFWPFFQKQSEGSISQLSPDPPLPNYHSLRSLSRHFFSLTIPAPNENGIPPAICFCTWPFRGPQTTLMYKFPRTSILPLRGSFCPY